MHSEGFKVGSTFRVNDNIVGVIRTKVIENCGAVQHPIKNVVMDILDMEKESSKGKVTAGDPCRNSIKLCMQRVGTKEGVSLVPEGSVRPKGARRKMGGSSARNCMPQVCTLVLSNFVKGKYEIPKDFPEGYKTSHKVAEQLAQCLIWPVKGFQAYNNDMTSTYVYDGVHVGNFKHDNWCLVLTTSQEKFMQKRSSAIIDKKYVKCNVLIVK